MIMNHDDVFCNFVTEDWMSFKCTKCGAEVVSEHVQETMPIFICSYRFTKHESKDPTLSQKVKNFANSLYGHISEGMPMCTDEQIEKRFATCSECEFFNNGVCDQCGCPLFKHKKFISKLAWADQECPVGKWKKEI